MNTLNISTEYISALLKIKFALVNSMGVKVAKHGNKAEISEINIDPKELNVNAEDFSNIIGNDAKYNSEKILEIFKGQDNDFSKAVSLNAAAGLVVSENEKEYKIAYNKVRDHILSGDAYLHLEKIRNA